MSNTANPTKSASPEPKPAGDGQSVIDLFVERVAEAEKYAQSRVDAASDNAERDSLIRKIEEAPDEGTAEKLAGKLRTIEDRVKVRTIRAAADDRGLEEAIAAAKALLGPMKSKARALLGATVDPLQQQAETILAGACGTPPSFTAVQSSSDLVEELPPFARASAHRSALSGWFLSGSVLSNLTRIRDGLEALVADLPVIEAEAKAAVEAARQLAGAFAEPANS